MSGPTIDSSSEKSASFASELLDDRFDHEVASGERVELCRQRQLLERSRALVGRHALLVDLALEEVRDPVACLLTEVVGDLAAHGLVSRFDRELGDPGAHRAQADNADRADLGTRHDARCYRRSRTAGLVQRTWRRLRAISSMRESAPATYASGPTSTRNVMRR